MIFKNISRAKFRICHLYVLIVCYQMITFNSFIVYDFYLDIYLDMICTKEESSFFTPMPRTTYLSEGPTNHMLSPLPACQILLYCTIHYRCKYQCITSNQPTIKHRTYAISSPLRRNSYQLATCDLVDQSTSNLEDQLNMSVQSSKIVVLKGTW